MEPHFMKLPTKSYCAVVLPEAVWNSVVGVASEDIRFLRASALGRSHSVSLCGLKVCIVAPKHFHFTITALTVIRAALAGQKICWKDGIL
jgi:hypothetical protein